MPFCARPAVMDGGGTLLRTHPPSRSLHHGSLLDPPEAAPSVLPCPSRPQCSSARPQPQLPSHAPCPATVPRADCSVLATDRFCNSLREATRAAGSSSCSRCPSTQRHWPRGSCAVGRLARSRTHTASPEQRRRRRGNFVCR